MARNPTTAASPSQQGAPMIAQSPSARAISIPRPELRLAGKICTALLLFLGLGATGGGAMLVASPNGSSMQWDLKMLQGSPFADFLIPGLILLGLFGIGSFVVAGLGIARFRIAPFLAFAIGCGLMIWITVELAIIKELSFLHPTMFAIGLGIAAAAVPWGRPTLSAWRQAR
jgi:hypothetical protein